VVDVLSEDITMDNANQQSQYACYAEDSTNYSIEHINCDRCEEMSTRL
jgi:hypothetical protein